MPTKLSPKERIVTVLKLAGLVLVSIAGYLSCWSYVAAAKDFTLYIDDPSGATTSGKWRQPGRYGEFSSGTRPKQIPDGEVKKGDLLRTTGGAVDALLDGPRDEWGVNIGMPIYRGVFNTKHLVHHKRLTIVEWSWHLKWVRIPLLLFVLFCWWKVIAGMGRTTESPVASDESDSGESVGTQPVTS